MHHLLTEWAPHGFCFAWSLAVLIPAMIGNVLIALAYYTIPAWLLSVHRARPDLIPPWFSLSFSVFIAFCGTGHLVKLWTIWFPNYQFEAWWDVTTGAVSVTTAVVVWLVRSRVLAIPDAAEFRRLTTDAKARQEHLEDVMRRLEEAAKMRPLDEATR